MCTTPIRRSPASRRWSRRPTIRPASARPNVAAEFIAEARRILAGEKKANGVTLRGFSTKPALPSYEEVYGLRAAAIAVYPMYKGLARLVGMQIVGQAQTLAEQMAVLQKHWNDFDFFFLHFKYTDSTGEDGAFDTKVKRIEELDAAMPEITALKPTVLIVTGDHSTPSFLKSHSWHPVPTLLVLRLLPLRRVQEIRRKRSPARRPRPIRSEIPDAAGAGQRGAVGKIWGVRNGRGQRAAAIPPSPPTSCRRPHGVGWAGRASGRRRGDPAVAKTESDGEDDDA